MQYLILFLYCVVVAVAYGSVFKKKFSESLAPAFFIHIFIMLFSAMLFHRISLGIAIGIVLACGIIIYKIVIAFREKRWLSFDVVNDTGLLIYV